MKGPKRNVNLALPVDCHARVKELADDTDRTVPSYIRMIVYNYLCRLDKLDQEDDDWWVVK